MGIAEIVALASLVLAIALPALAANKAEAKAKGRAETIEKATNDALLSLKAEQDKLAAKMHEIDKAAALDHQTVEGFCERIDDLRADMDKRFDKLESMITAKAR